MVGWMARGAYRHRLVGRLGDRNEKKQNCFHPHFHSVYNNVSTEHTQSFCKYQWKFWGESCMKPAIDTYARRQMNETLIPHLYP